MQLATMKARSEVLLLRQDFEVRKYREKYADTAALATVPEGRALAGGAGASGDNAGGGSGDEASEAADVVSIGSAEAFDEPLRVRLNCCHDLLSTSAWRAPCAEVDGSTTAQVTCDMCCVHAID